MTRPPNRVRATWAGEHRFDAGRPDGPTVRIDASGQTGPGPVDALLIACATCTAVDVVDILAKRRTPVESLTVDVVGHRFDGVPRRLVHVQLEYTITGAGIDRANAERAIELAVDKYCSVRDSLDPKIPVEWGLVLNGEARDGEAGAPGVELTAGPA
jgi:putative redox protein